MHSFNQYVTKISNEHYRLFLAGVISENRYYELCEAEDGNMPPADAADPIKGLGGARQKFDNFLSTFENLKVLANQNAKDLFDAFLGSFLDHSKLSVSQLKAEFLSVIDEHEKAEKAKANTGTQDAVSPNISDMPA